MVIKAHESYDYESHFLPLKRLKFNYAKLDAGTTQNGCAIATAWW
jgi:hypothetical protein